MLLLLSCAHTCHRIGTNFGEVLKRHIVVKGIHHYEIKFIFKPIQFFLPQTVHIKMFVHQPYNDFKQTEFFFVYGRI